MVCVLEKEYREEDEGFDAKKRPTANAVRRFLAVLNLMYILDAVSTSRKQKTHRPATVFRVGIDLEMAVFILELNVYCTFSYHSSGWLEKYQSILGTCFTGGISSKAGNGLRQTRSLTQIQYSLPIRQPCVHSAAYCATMLRVCVSTITFPFRYFRHRYRPVESTQQSQIL